MKNFSKKIIIGNWKMNLDYKDSIILAKKINKNFRRKAPSSIVLLPDFLSLSEISKNFKNKNISYGAQDVAPFTLGSYTGEVSVESLKDLKCSYILIGHSERRKYLAEDKLISAKINNVLTNSNIIPILCVGESLEQKKDGETLAVIKEQLKEAFSKVKSLKGKKLIIAYEPLWAIGTGKVILPAEAVLIHKEIRKIIQTMFATSLPSEFGILYGGSINLRNYEDFKNIEDISGLLIGGASLKASDFSKIVNNF